MDPSTLPILGSKKEVPVITGTQPVVTYNRVRTSIFSYLTLCTSHRTRQSAGRMSQFSHLMSNEQIPLPVPIPIPCLLLISHTNPIRCFLKSSVQTICFLHCSSRRFATATIQHSRQQSSTREVDC